MAENRGEFRLKEFFWKDQTGNMIQARERATKIQTNERQNPGESGGRPN